MAEFWDIYDKNRNKTGKLAERDGYEFKDGEYHVVVTGIIFNSKYEILISKRASWKKYGGLWECNGGSILAGETSLEGILRELKEELGIAFTEKYAIFLPVTPCTFTTKILLLVNITWSLIVLNAHIIFSPSTNNFSISGRTSFISIAFMFKKLESKLIPVEIFGITSPPFLFLTI